MGKLSEKYPQCTAAYEADEDEAWVQFQLQHEDEMTTREENFQRELMQMKLSGLNNLVESVHSMVEAIKETNKKPSIMNVYLTVGRDVPPNQVSELIKSLEIPID